MKEYTKHFSTRTPQSLKIPRSDQVPNRAGGWAFPVDDKVQATRFLILGSADGSYYASPRELTRENVACLDRLCEDGKGPWLVDQIVDISVSGRAPRQDPCIFALAFCLRQGDLDTRRKAAGVVPEVCRTGTHLASFAEALKAFPGPNNGTTGWSPVVKRAIQSWFESKSDEALAYQLIKYRQRQGWSSRDFLRKARPKPTSATVRESLLGWAAGHGENVLGSPDIITAFALLHAQPGVTSAEAVKLIRDHRLPWEAVPDRFARDLDVQEALFWNMPMTALVRQLGRLTSIGLLTPGDERAQRVVSRVTSEEALSKARIHPLNLYVAAEIYNSGFGMRGKLKWTPIPSITEALGVGFFKAFGNVVPTNKKIVVGVDCSGSMTARVLNVPMEAREAAFAMAAVTLRTEPNARGVAFSTYAQEFDLHGIESLQELALRTRQIGQQVHGGTDASQPILLAGKQQWEVDAFLTCTDNETWCGRIHPIEALWQYRQASERDTKLISAAFTATSYSVTPDHDDSGTMAMIGFDESLPQLVSDFVK
jgi:60 kDa SS-A/Ro ribonucleoprotein